MNDEARPRRGRPRRRSDGGGGQRRQSTARTGTYPRRRNEYGTGQYSSIYAGPFPTDEDGEDEGLNLATLQAKPIEELRELAGEHGIENGDELEHSDLVLKLLDVVPLAPAHKAEPNGQVPGVAEGILEIVDEGFGFLRRHGV
ncbi:MAG TPA: Rho termination factor N-terminal domain-containing protein, partial [Candidatus Limnocylindria bacterium]|nr:Rho termination factor N-terminal domain-containing protein [Candidatus Limnocylindria bacterium]